MTDHNGLVIVSSIDTTTLAYSKGIRPGMEIIGWNTLPVKKKLETIPVGKYRKLFPMHSDLQIQLMLLPRGKPDESAEVFFMTPSGNNWGIRLTTRL